MHIIARAAIVRPYLLIKLNYQGVVVSEQGYESLEELAKAASSAAYYLEERAESWYRLPSDAVRQKALSPRGKLLNIAELVAWGRRLRRSGYWSHRAHVFRSGPVPSTRKWRGGSGQTNCRTQAERRSNAMVVKEDGEVSVRAARLGFNLPCSWDGRYRDVERCWKSQHKGGKSWDRPARHGEKV